MKTIKIMIAASEEMHEEKLEFTNLIEHLNEVLEPRGIELKRIKWDPETDGSIEEYKSKLKECEMCLTLYWRDMAGNSEQELDTAYQELKDGSNPRNLYVFFKEPTEELSEALKDFKANFVTKYGHFFCKFENVDTMNLHFILQFEAYQNHLRIKDDPLVKVVGGKVTVANKDFVNLDNIPFAALNKEYQRLQKELLDLDIQVTEVRKRYKEDPDNEDIEDELMAIKSKRKKLADEFEKYQIHLYDIALNFAKTAGEKYSERMRKARELFELGDVIGADQILNMEEMKRDRQRESEQKKVHEENLVILMNEFLEKTKTVMTNTLFSIPERFSIACEAYEEAIGIAKVLHSQNRNYADLCTEYALFLFSFQLFDKSLLYIEKAIISYHQCPNINEVKSFIPTLLSLQAGIFNKLGNNDSAKEKAQLSIKLSLDNLQHSCSRDTTITLCGCMNDTAVIYKNCNENDKAINIINSAVNYLEQIPNSQRDDTINLLLSSIYINKANILRRSNQFEQAEESLKNAFEKIEIINSATKASHLYAIRSYMGMGNVLSDQSKYDDAIIMFNKALQEIRLIEESDYEQLEVKPKIYLNLAATYREKGDYSNAIIIYKDYIKYVNLLPKETCMNNIKEYFGVLHDIATLSSLTDNHEDVSIYYSKLVDFCEQMPLNIEEDLLDRIVLNLLSITIETENQTPKQVVVVEYQKVVEILMHLTNISINETYSNQLANALNHFAIFLYHQDELNASEKLLNESYEICRKHIESSPKVFMPTMAWSLWNNACLHMKKGENDKAEMELKARIEILRNIPEYEISIAQSYFKLGVIHYVNGDFNNSKNDFAESLSILQYCIESHKSIDILLLEDTLKNLYAIYSREKDKEKMLEACRLLDNYIYSYLPDDSKVEVLAKKAENWKNMAILYENMNRKDEAILAYNEAIQTFYLLVKNNEHLYLSKIAPLLYALAYLHLDYSKSYNESYREFKSAFDIYSKLNEETDKDFTDSMNHIKKILDCFHVDSTQEDIDNENN